MPKASPIQYSFNSGEMSPRMKGRIDVQRYKSGCETMLNFFPQIQGPARKRSGTRFVAEVKNSAHNARLIPFEFSTEQAYILEFGDQYIRFYKDGGVIESAPSTPYEISTPYAHTDVGDLHFAQSADVIFIAHPSHPPYKLGRTSDTSWSLDEIEFDWPAFNDQNISATTVTASATTGTITLTASASLFSTGDIGGYFRFEEPIASKHDLWEAGKAVTIGDFRRYGDNLYKADISGTTGTRPPVHTDGAESDGTVTWSYQHSGAGYAKLTVFTSDTQVTASVVKILPDSSTSGTKRWSFSAWSYLSGYPKSVAFYEDRLWWAGSPAKPQTLWASVSGDYENHLYGTEDDSALNYTINSQEVNTIEWMVPGKQLTVGTSGGEFIVAASSADQAITPTNVRITPQTTFGDADIQPFRIGGAVVFVQRSLRKVRELIYDFNTDSYNAPNLTSIADHILDAGAVDMAYQQEPDQIIWIPDANGQIVALTYERTEQVVAWSRHSVGGSVESITTIPHWDGDQDSTWMVVNRTIDGGTVRYIEYFEKQILDDDAIYLDSAYSYSGSPVTTVPGLDHLEGETVSILADGYAHPDRVVSSGQITLTASASTVNVGLSFTARLKTFPVEAGAADGTSQGKEMRINNIVMRLDNTGPGLFYGPSETSLDEYHPRGSTDLMDNPVPLYSGDTRLLPWPGEYEKAPQMVIEHSLPFPCTIVALMPQVHTYDR